MPSRLLLTDGWLLPMAPDLPTVIRGDLLVEDGRIVRVGRFGPVADAEVLSCTGRIVLPGLVDTHRHTWQTSLRAIAADWTLGQYFERMRGRLGDGFEPEDIYAGTHLGLLEALAGGITTLVDWSHNINSPAHADAGWQALVDSGARAVFAYGVSNRQATGRDRSLHTRDVARLRTELAASDAALVTLAMAVRGPETSTVQTCAADWAMARELAVPMTVHVGGGLRGAGGGIWALAEHDLLGPDITYVHCNMLGDDELDLIAGSGGRASVAPEVEANMGHGPAATGRLRARGIPTGLSVDVCTNVGGDLFAAMRTALAVHRGQANAEALARGETPASVSMTALDALRMATVEGAKACGLDDRIGSPAPGKQADVLVLRATDLNLAPVNDPVSAAVLAAHPGNVEHVFVAGRAVKRDGALVGQDPAAAVARAEESRDRLLRRAGVDAVSWYPVAVGPRSTSSVPT
ncbi:MAG TPA: amidohydrolase family protein [Pseudonocardia sp.]|uniref:amidohydrolase family protein n=1 Tax=Pseudonocardia sp. TaxID=60912 RepID=UPI002ED89368